MELAGKPVFLHAVGLCWRTVAGGAQGRDSSGYSAGTDTFRNAVPAAFAGGTSQLPAVDQAPPPVALQMAAPLAAVPMVTAMEPDPAENEYVFPKTGFAQARPLTSGGVAPAYVMTAYVPLRQKAASESA